MKIKFGFCGCGCGERTKVSRDNGLNKFIHGHHSRVNPTNFSHGQSRHGLVTPEYRAFRTAKAHCTIPTIQSWHRYGGRGIRFLFHSFEQFFKELGPKPSRKHTLDRINNDGNYEPGNVQWATKSHQRQNQERVIFHWQDELISEAIGN